MDTVTTTWAVTMPFLAGVAVHLVVRPLHEIDHHALRFIAAASLAPAACFAGLYLYLRLQAVAALAATVAATSSFACGLVGSLLVYRVFFHRLRRFPGPLPAKVSRFYAMSKAAETKQSHLFLERLHEEYGDFVRVGACRYFQGSIYIYS